MREGRRYSPSLPNDVSVCLTEILSYRFTHFNLSNICSSLCCCCSRRRAFSFSLRSCRHLRRFFLRCFIFSFLSLLRRRRFCNDDMDFISGSVCTTPNRIKCPKFCMNDAQKGSQRPQKEGNLLEGRDFPPFPQLLSVPIAKPRAEACREV